jgi:hypothetical protein
MKKTMPTVTVELSPSLPHHRSILTLTCRRFFILIPSSLVQRIDGNAIVSSPALERALRVAASTSSPFRVQWTVVGRATTPSASPRPPLHLPPSTLSSRAAILEIGIIFLQLRSPRSIFDFSLSEIEPSPFIQGEAPPPRHSASHRRQPSFADLIRAPGRRRASSPSVVNPGDAPPPPPHRGRAILARAGRRREEELGKEKERERKNSVQGHFSTYTTLSLHFYRK